MKNLASTTWTGACAKFVDFWIVRTLHACLTLVSTGGEQQASGAAITHQLGPSVGSTQFSVEFSFSVFPRPESNNPLVWNMRTMTRYLWRWLIRFSFIGFFSYFSEWIWISKMRVERDLIFYSDSLDCSREGPPSVHSLLLRYGRYFSWELNSTWASLLVSGSYSSGVAQGVNSRLILSHHQLSVQFPICSSPKNLISYHFLPSSEHKHATLYPLMAS